MGSGRDASQFPGDHALQGPAAVCCVLRTMGLGRPMPGHCRVLLQAVVDLGVKESCTGLTFVCLSRAKNIRDLVVEPMAFDRLSRLRESPTLKARMDEEVRLRQLALDTVSRYLGVFSGGGV